MIKFVDFKVTFSEVPDEITLCINLSCCPHKCDGCHSPYLQKDIGEILNKSELDNLIKDNSGITCVSFMGGDNDIPSLCYLANYVKEKYNLKVCWYTGLGWSPSQMYGPIVKTFDYIKTGPYIKELGPLTSKTTNQRFYINGIHLNKPDANPDMFYDITDRFWNDENRA